MPENLARFGVKHSLWGFMRKLSGECPNFIAARRKRCGPNSPDPAAFGAGFKPNPPSACDASPFADASAAASVAAGDGSLRRAESNPAGSLSPQSSADMGGDVVGRGGLRRTKSQSKVRGFAAFAIASGLALLMRKSPSSNKLAHSASMPRLVSGGGGSLTATTGGSLRRANSGQLRRSRSRVAFSSENGCSLLEVDGL